ncbi:hypothetical protein FRC06_002356, partial [Ceratobasidium sp. 370]
AHSGVFNDPIAEEPNNVIPAEQFDPGLVEPYQPWYNVEQLAALATRVHLIDDEDLDMVDNQEHGRDEEMQSDDGGAGLGPATLHNRRTRASGADETEQGDYNDMETDDSGSDE